MFEMLQNKCEHVETLTLNQKYLLRCNRRCAIMCCCVVVLLRRKRDQTLNVPKENLQFHNMEGKRGKNKFAENLSFLVVFAVFEFTYQS